MSVADRETRDVLLESIEDLAERIRRGEFIGLCFVALPADGDMFAVGLSGHVFKDVAGVHDALQELCRALADGTAS